MSNTICPYPGLRPFNEEESIFFKGREQQVERLVKRLEEKKFLMVNGASGDGKSSLIYAGVIPYAKAGFFKARYNNWIVADFRPERSPLKNLTASLCKQLKVEDQAKTEKELGYGFSALCDLYKASSFYVDESSATWQQADEKERKALKRKGANLLVLVDQFEEFFTNPENYQNGIPSLESQKTINLLLESYKLAAAHDLPIYVVCTMRSDYIGQCAAFRGLPEAIGYSQFFVPRLKRQEIEQVIEGPAELSGCKISKRLTQTLLNSLTEGFDQLPILQHALHQIWKMAKSGTEEMDLIHLAMIGGISPLALSLEDKVKFKNWLELIPAYKSKLFEKPSLANILNAHANELYLTAHHIYQQKFGKEISIELSQKIIKNVFQCLTKIDASRAVRNRMTLQEITEIINDEKINLEMVDGLLQVYREQGNTFLQPFIGENAENTKLEAHTVLDITHESLIRNWTQLTDWANEEFENLQNYLDFNKQLQRWVNANYSSGYLLPIGPLTFFENWFEKLNASKYWINRYEDFEGGRNNQLILAESKLSEAQKFLERSSRRLIVTKTILKYGAQRIAIAAGLLLLIGLCTYYYFDFRKKQNEDVVVELLNQGKDLLKSPNINLSAKASFIINTFRFDEIRGQNNQIESLINQLDSDTLKIDVYLEIIKKCASYSLTETEYIKFSNDSLIYDKRLKLSQLALLKCAELLPLLINDTTINKDQNFIKTNIVRINNVISSAALLKSHQPHSNNIESLNISIVKETKKLLTAILKNSKQIVITRDDLYYTIMNLLAIDNNPHYEELLSVISPFEQKAGNMVSLANMDTNANDVRISNEILHAHAKFEILSILYATQFEQNDKSKFYLKCLLDSSLFYNPHYNPQNILDVLLKFSKHPVENVEMIRSLTGQSLLIDELQFWGNNCKSLFQEIANGNNYLKNDFRKLIHFIPDANAEALWLKYFQSIMALPNLNYLVQFQLAQYYKLKGFYDDFKYEDRQKVMDDFELAMQNFESIPNEFRQIEFSESSLNDDQISISENFMHLFPVVSYEEVNGNSNYASDEFILTKNKQKSSTIFYDYLLEKEKQKLFYTNYGQAALGKSILLGNQEKQRLHFKNIINHLAAEKVSFADPTLFSVFRFNNLIEGNLTNQGFSDEAFKFIQRCAVDNIYYKHFLHELMVMAAKKGNEKLVLTLLNKFEKKERMGELILLLNEIIDGEGVEYTFAYLSQIYKIKKNETDNLAAIYRILGKIGGNAIEKLAKVEYRNIPEMLKPFVLTNWVTGTAENGNYYKASKMINDDLSEFQELNLINLILYSEIIKQAHKGSNNAHTGIWNDSQYYRENIGDTEVMLFGF